MILPIPKDWPPDRFGFILAYQGGHHDVWCDKSVHITTHGGGKTGISKPYGLRLPSRCNCSEFKK